MEVLFEADNVFVNRYIAQYDKEELDKVVGRGATSSHATHVCTA